MAPRSSSVFAPLDVPGRPLTLILNREGVVGECLIGGRGYSEFEAGLGKYLGPS